MAVGVAVITAVIPGFLWLWVFTHGRSYRNAPLKILLITFLLGMLSTVPVILIYTLLVTFDVVELDIQDLAFANLGTVAIAMFFVVGPVEETSKFLAVRLGVYRTRHLREPLDGLIYGAAASLGFATAENISYALNLGAEIMIVRGPVSTLAHVIFGSIWALSLNPQAGAARRRLYGLSALAAAALLHGLFNVLLFSSNTNPLLTLAAFGLVAAGGIIVFRMFRLTKSRSTYHLRRNIPLPVCPLCMTAYRRDDNFCHGCGTQTKYLSPQRQRCANCEVETTPGSAFCMGCGDLFVYEKR